jgi:hypothetical protein
MMVGIGYLFGGRARKGVPVTEGCLRGVKWTLSMLHAAARNSWLLSTWFRCSSRDVTIYYVVVETKWTNCYNIRRAITLLEQ